MRGATGSGTQRLYGFRDILVLKVVKRLLDTGVSLQQIRVAISHLRERGVEDLAQITLMSDGASVYECTSADEVIDLVQGGQGVFGIAVGRVWREVEGELARCPASAPTTRPPRPPRRRAHRSPRGAATGLSAAARRHDTAGAYTTAPAPAPSGPAGPRRGRLAALTIPRGRVLARRTGTGGAPKGQTPRNLSGARTARDRQLWSDVTGSTDGEAIRPPNPQEPHVEPSHPVPVDPPHVHRARVRRVRRPPHRPGRRRCRHACSRPSATTRSTPWWTPRVPGAIRIDAPLGLDRRPLRGRGRSRSCAGSPAATGPAAR